MITLKVGDTVKIHKTNEVVRETYSCSRFYRISRFIIVSIIISDTYNDITVDSFKFKNKACAKENLHMLAKKPASILVTDEKDKDNDCEERYVLYDGEFFLTVSSYDIEAII